MSYLLQNRFVVLAIKSFKLKLIFSSFLQFLIRRQKYINICLEYLFLVHIIDKN